MSHTARDNRPEQAALVGAGYFSSSNRDVIVHDPHPRPSGFAAYPIIARELCVEMQGNEPRYHIVRFANGQHVRLSAAWVRPIPHVPGMGPVTSSLAESL